MKTSTRYLITALIILSLGLLLWQHYGMNRSLRIDFSNPAQFSAFDDRELGGASTASVQASKDGAIMHCQLNDKQHIWRFCGLAIDLGQGQKGVNLSAYDEMQLELAMQTASGSSLNVYLGNFEAYSNNKELISLKLHGTLVTTTPYRSTIKIPLASLTVPTWWLEEGFAPVYDPVARLDNIRKIALSTSDGSASGQYRISLHALEFHGKWISKTNLQTGLLAFWLLAALAYVLKSWLDAYRLAQIEQKKRTRAEQSHEKLAAKANQLQQKVMTDPLTGALNREGLSDFLLRVDLNGLSVLFADMDHFKRVNDGYGHAVGDAVLQQLSALIKTTIRKTDRLVRWGGEEFLIICPATSVTEAGILAEKLRTAVCASNWPADLSMSCSFGAAECQENEDFARTIERADAALYRAKAQGRNRVELAR
ncbi:diguanylate cyclase [Chitinibacter sp. S2-10]|uniref:diguanylate cyclase n=1 Tax=Chitinibacter sp. S2-10 TaxID=3373597 RepID=UPI0039773436